RATAGSSWRPRPQAPSPPLPARAATGLRAGRPRGQRGPDSRGPVAKSPRPSRIYATADYFLMREHVEDLPSFFRRGRVEAGEQPPGRVFHGLLAGYRVDQGQQGGTHAFLGYSVEARRLADPILDEAGFEAGGSVGPLVRRDRQYPARQGAEPGE